MAPEWIWDEKLAAGAGAPAGPHGSLHGADAWHWHRQEAYTDARHACPWCAPCDGGQQVPRRRLRPAELDEMIARIEEARSMAVPWGWPGAMWPLAAWPWRAAAPGPADGPAERGPGAWHARLRAARLPTL